MSREELYNLQHSQAWNVVERIFGVLKKKWGILTCPPQFDMAVQVQVPPALAALHNFIMDHDPDDVNQFLNSDEGDLDPNPGAMRENDFGLLADGAVTQAERNRATQLQDRIAQQMWESYQAELEARGRI